MAIAKFIDAIANGRRVQLFGDGSSRRDYTYIDDIADGVEAALNREAPGFEIVNLGGATPVTLTELVAAIEKATGRTAILDRQPSQPGDVPVTYAAVEKARRLLEFRARVPLAEGLKRSVDWYRRGRSGAGRQPAA
jgi:UDP-glucuronate 4-epimerase